MNPVAKKKAKPFFFYVQHFETFMMLALLTAIFLVVCMQVFCRFVIERSLPWSEELTGYLFVWLTFLGFSYNARTEDHPRVTFLVDRLGPSAQQVSTMLSRVCLLVLSVAVANQGFRNALLQLNTSRRAISFPVSMFWFSLSIPVGFVLAGVYSLAQIVQALYRQKKSSLTSCD